MRIEYFIATVRYYALCVYFLFNDQNIIQTCLNGKINNEKKLKHVAIVINNLRETLTLLD